MRKTAEERKKQIVDESLNIIYEKGFMQFTIRNIAQRVGISEAGIYRHFDSKNDIIFSILDRMNEFGEEISEQIKSIEDPIKKINRFFLLQLKYFEDNQELAMILLSEEIFNNHDDLRKKFNSILNKRFENLIDLLTKAAQKNRIDKSEIEDIAFILQGTMRGLVFRWNLNEYDFDLKSRGEELLDTIFANFTK